VHKAAKAASLKGEQKMSNEKYALMNSSHVEMSLVLQWKSNRLITATGTPKDDTYCRTSRRPAYRNTSAVEYAKRMSAARVGFITHCQPPVEPYNSFLVPLC
jgi:hypothetical protein